MREQTACLPYVRFRIAPARLQELLAHHVADCDWMRARLPDLNLRAGLEADAGIAAIFRARCLCAVAAALEGQLCALCPVVVPPHSDADCGDADSDSASAPAVTTAPLLLTRQMRGGGLFRGWQNWDGGGRERAELPHAS